MALAIQARGLVKAFGDVTGPNAVVLAAVVNGADVDLSWTASASPDDDEEACFWSPSAAPP